jgi:alkylation response protein AidB-like acyl-CoA dehydrogenase
VRAQAADRIAPAAVAVDREQRYSPALWAAVRDMGLLGLPFDEELGGSGATFLAYIVATEEVARYSAIAALYPGTTVQVARTILEHGSAEQIRGFVPPLVAGEHIAAWAFTEPATGSDPKQITTRAESVRGGWRLNGVKAFISYAGQAKEALVFARTGEHSLGAFLVDTSQPGWGVGRAPKLLCFGGGEAAEVTLVDVEVPDDRVIGDPTRGFNVMLTGEAQGKLRASAICVGIAQRAVDEAVAYASTRLHRGISLGQRFPTIQALLGDMESEVLGARAMVRSCADLLDAGRMVSKEAAASRLVTARAAREVASMAMQVCGAYGLTQDLPVERLYREAKFFEVAQGVAELQKVLVARELLGEH